MLRSDFIKMEYDFKIAHKKIGHYIVCKDRFLKNILVNYFETSLTISTSKTKSAFGGIPGLPLSP